MVEGEPARGTPQLGDTRIVAVVYGEGQLEIVSVLAEVLGKPFASKSGFQDVSQRDRGSVVGIAATDAKRSIVDSQDKAMVVSIHMHRVDLGMPPDSYLSTHCDYEFLYDNSPYFRRDLTRFAAFVLGQLSHHDELMAKPRTYFISTTFPDVRAALPNIDILTVGSDAVEMRVDLLREPTGDETFADIPSLSYVGAQLMLLRQRTELPIIFTTRSTDFSNGRFPLENPNLYFDYLYRAIQWGVEYIDVELWLPEEMRRKLFELRGNSRIMSAFHDFSGTFRWTSKHAEETFQRSMQFSDIVKMIAIISDQNENFELEYFRSKMRAEYPDAPPFSAVNMGEVGQISRTFNKVFTPVTHPLLPIVAAPGQLSTAEIHSGLAMMGQLPRKNFYGISNSPFRNAVPQAPFYEKCFNELGLPHQFGVVQRDNNKTGGLELWCDQKGFGGAYLEPGLPHTQMIKTSPFFSRINNDNGPILTEAARAIGIVDTIVVRGAPSSSTSTSAPSSMPPSPRQRSTESLVVPSHERLAVGSMVMFDNATWRGILRTLTLDLAPSAYFGRSAVVLAASADDAGAVLFAMRALKISKVYTVGFRTPPSLAEGSPPVEPFQSLESLQRARSHRGDGAPFVIVSALRPEKSHLVAMLIRAFGTGDGQDGPPAKKVFLDLADGATGNSRDLSRTAEQHGFASYQASNVAAFTTVERLRLLVGQNVPCSFVRLASGRNAY